MEALLKLYDDTDDWLTTAWLASGPLLWTLLTFLIGSVVLSVSHWFPGLTWPVLACLVTLTGLTPVFRRSLKRASCKS